MGYDMMEWTSRTSAEWDWEAVSLCSGKATEIPEQLQSLNHEIGVDGRVHNGSIYSFGNGGFSGSDLTHGSSFKCSISASADSSSKESTDTFTSVALPKNFREKNNPARVDNTGSFTKLGASIGSGEPLIGLKLGKRTYFEDACPATMCKASSLPIVSAPVNTTKRSRAVYQSAEAPHCQVEGCNLDLNSAKDYHRRHRICEDHSKSPKVIVAGMARRFCQQCSRFHDLSAFDDKKRSCRRRLSDHNARRRRPQLEKIDFNSASLSSSAYDGRHQINFVSDRVPIPIANSAWQNTCSFKVVPSGASLIKPTKVGVTDRHLDFADNDILNAVSMLHHDTARVLSFDRGTPGRNKGMETSTIPSTLDGTADFRRALSLLSTNPCGSNHPQSSNLDQFMHVESQNWAGSSDYVRSEQLPTEHRLHSFNFRNSSSNSISFQEFPPFRAYDSGCIYSNQIN